MGLAKTVATNTAALVLKAKTVASKCEEYTQNRVIGVATQCALATSQLVACAKVIRFFLFFPKTVKDLEVGLRGYSYFLREG